MNPRLVPGDFFVARSHKVPWLAFASQFTAFQAGPAIRGSRPATSWTDLALQALKIDSQTRELNRFASRAVCCSQDVADGP